MKFWYRFSQCAVIKNICEWIVFLNHFMEALVIEQGKIFIEGVETTDPVLIGYAIIDLVQDGKKLFIENSIEEVFSEKDMVFVKHDQDQLPRMIIGVEISNDSVVYNCMSGTELSNHYAYELSKTKNLTL